MCGPWELYLKYTFLSSIFPHSFLAVCLLSDESGGVDKIGVSISIVE